MNVASFQSLWSLPLIDGIHNNNYPFPDDRRTIVSLSLLVPCPHTVQRANSSTGQLFTVLVPDRPSCSRRRGGSLHQVLAISFRLQYVQYCTISLPSIVEYRNLLHCPSDYVSIVDYSPSISRYSVCFVVALFMQSSAAQDILILLQVFQGNGVGYSCTVDTVTSPINRYGA